MQWFLPTFHGDIRLERLGKSHTKLVLVSLTPSEKVAVETLRKIALAPPWKGTPWCSVEQFPPIKQLRGEAQIELRAPLGRVQKTLAKELKPDRTLMSVVKFTDGRMEEVTDWTEPKEPPKDPYREPAGSPEPEASKALVKEEKPEAAAGTTVAQPTRGCPVPEFEKANVRATSVLRAFLTPQQIEDFERKQRFITTGAETGHRYMLTSRLAHDEYGQHHGHRQMFDLDEGHSFCVHDYMVPAAEELLALHLFLSIPGRERYLREIPE